MLLKGLADQAGGPRAHMPGAENWNQSSASARPAAARASLKPARKAGNSADIEPSLARTPRTPLARDIPGPVTTSLLPPPPAAAVRTWPAERQFHGNRCHSFQSRHFPR